MALLQFLHPPPANAAGDDCGENQKEPGRPQIVAVQAVPDIYANHQAGGSGGDAGGTSFTTVDRFLFDDDSRTTLGTGLSAGRQGGTAFAAIVA